MYLAWYILQYNFSELFFSRDQQVLAAGSHRLYKQQRRERSIGVRRATHGVARRRYFVVDVTHRQRGRGWEEGKESKRGGV